MSNPWLVLAVTVLLIAASAFFVAVEFALIGARRHRLQDAAATSASARAAVRSASELSVFLAGSQLGITICALALGAVTKPAVQYSVTPAIEGFGAPQWIADVGGFVFAMIVVTFLHLVVGEMAPKSWAIAHPEYSAKLLAIPMRMFMFVTRPLIVILNAAANWLLVKVGVTPVDEVLAGQDPGALRKLVEHSATVGTLDTRYYLQLAGALDLETLTIGDIVTPDPHPSGVPVDADPRTMREMADSSGHLRLVVTDGARTVGVVHVRDAIGTDSSVTARDLMRDLLVLDPATTVADALDTMRASRSHIAVVGRSGDGAGSEVVGVVTLADVLGRLMPNWGVSAPPRGDHGESVR